VGLHVAVNHAAPVCVLEGGADIRPELGDVTVAQRPRTSELGQRRAFDQLADEQGTVTV
jgi:hypothetical protein